MTVKAQAKAILHGLDGETMEIDLEGPPFPLRIEGNWFWYPNEEVVYPFDRRPDQDETSLEQHYQIDDGRTAFRESYGL